MSNKLTSSAIEEYLEAIYRLSRQESPVPLGRLARHLDISPVSANEMVRKMSDQGRLIYQPYAGVSLTSQGRTEAKAIVRRHRLWERMLTDVLGMPWHLVHQEACRLEHATSEMLESHLAAFLQQPQSCPHGQPLPGSQSIEKQRLPLTSLESGQRAELVSVLNEDAEFLRALDQAGLRPGVIVEMIRVQPALGILTVRAREREVAISREVAEQLRVAFLEER